VPRALTLRLAADRTVTVDCMVTPLDEVASGVMLLEFTQVDSKLRISREDRLLSQEATVRSILWGLAYAINLPLGGLRGAAQLLECALPDAQWREFTRIIIGEVDRLQALVASGRQRLGVWQSAPTTIPPSRRWKAIPNGSSKPCSTSCAMPCKRWPACRNCA